MGVDLYMLPFDSGSSNEICFSHTILNCERRRDLWDAIDGLLQLPVPKGFSGFLGMGTTGEYGYGEIIETPYGEPLKYTTAGALLTVKDHLGVKDNEKNRAVWAYLLARAPSTRVALYWH